MSDLKLYLFGAPRLEFRGQLVEGIRRKSAALAAYLAMTERPQTREAIAALLWQDQDEEHSRTSLRSSLHNLTSAFEVEWLDAGRQLISIHFDEVEVDARQFLDAISQTRRHLHADGVLCDACFAALNGAVDLYKDHFLAGFNLNDSLEFDNWQSTQREWLSRECVGVLRRLAEHSAATDSQKAIAYVQRWLGIDSLDERAHRMLMQLYTANGQRNEALKQYQECERILDEELATLPEAETVSLYEMIRSGDTPPPIKKEVPTFDDLGSTSVLPPMPSLVVGREDALQELKLRVGIPAPETRRPITVIEGWPGVGKSTTIAAFAHDPALKTSLPDGILWTSLGENPNLLSKLMIWGEALHLIPPGKTLSLDELSSKINAALRDRRMLLLVDDVWQVEHATPFRVGGQGCTLVMSSRLNNVARSLAPSSADVYRLPVLNDEFALSLLRRLAPQAIDAHPTESLELVHNLEGLPLALQVAGRLLHEEMSMGWGVTDLLEELKNGLGLLSASAPGDVGSTENQAAPTVMTLLKRSTDSLDEETLIRFALLSLFSSKPATFDLAAMATAWEVDDPKPTIRKLVNRGLLEPISGGRFQMHALLVMHANALLEGAIA